ncbi:aminotransferase class III-fold pyridoxal phosphate-dependent enzyme [Streptomyces sp. NPDC059853]|uniref:aminotransferase class III-fold pyridoxal phosphate-dependent enzyme n=1 Tax=Streptomyces sp. NPDC059853 TaxID=3346973 RepID=UPI0036498712
MVIGSARGAWVTDVAGRRCPDLLAQSPALAFGHRHPRPVAEARARLNRLTLTSRAGHHEHVGALCARPAALCGMEMALPVSTGGGGVTGGAGGGALRDGGRSGRDGGAYAGRARRGSRRSVRPHAGLRASATGDGLGARTPRRSRVPRHTAEVVHDRNRHRPRRSLPAPARQR